MSTMTLAERRETLVNSLRASKSWTTGYAEAFVDDYVISTQPAQAVDVEAIREVAAELTAWPAPDRVIMADKLTRALSGEKAGLVDVVAWRWRETMHHGLPWDVTNDEDVISGMRRTGGYEIEPLTRAISGEKGLVGRYRLLGSADVIEPDDEFLDDNAVDWVRAGSASGGHLFIGMQYRLGVLKQARRPLPSSPAPDKEGKV